MDLSIVRTVELARSDKEKGSGKQYKYKLAKPSITDTTLLITKPAGQDLTSKPDIQYLNAEMDQLTKSEIQDILAELPTPLMSIPRRLH